MKRIIYSLVFVAACFMTSCSSDDDVKPQEVKITVNEKTTSTAVINFEAIEGAFIYNIDYAEFGNTLENDLSVATGQKLEHKFSELKADTKYTVKITAINASDAKIGEGTAEFTTEAALAALVGTWKYEYNNNFITYVFNADGFGEYKTPNGNKIIKWETTDTKLKITTYSDKVGGLSSTATLDYKIYTDLISINGTTYFPVK